MKQSTHQFHKIFFHISKCLACNAEKILQLKITKKRVNIANFLNIYIYIYTYIICNENENKNDSIHSILQHGRVADRNCCVVFPASGFQYLILCPRQSKWKVSTTYLAIRTKNN